MSEQPVIAFASAEEFRQWLALHHADHPGIWVKLAKKDSGIACVSYAQALDEALCFGWIDGQAKRFDETAWLQKFTRRGPRSVWSKNNVAHIERLDREGRMEPLGLAAVEAAKADGRWDAAYHGSRVAEMPADFLAELTKSKKAQAFFETLNKANRYAIYFRITTARKPETRARRISKFIEMLKKGQKVQ